MVKVKYLVKGIMNVALHLVATNTQTYKLIKKSSNFAVATFLFVYLVDYLRAFFL